MEPKEIATRLRRLRFTPREFAPLAHLSGETVRRLMSAAPAHSPNWETIDKARKALVAQELALRDELLRLHPLPASREQVAV